MTPQFLVGRRMLGVLGVPEYRRGLNSRSIDVYAIALPLCYTPHTSAVRTETVNR